VAGLRALGYDRAGRSVDPLLLRDGGAVAALLRRPGHSAFRGRPRAAVRGSLRPQGPGREGRRPDGHADRQGAGGSGRAARREAGGGAAARGRTDRHRRAALLPAEVHAQFGDRFRFAGGAELRRRNRAVPAVRGGARAQHSAQARGARRERCRFRGGAFPRSHGAAASVRGFLAGAAGGLQGRFGAGGRVSRGRAGARGAYAFQLAQAFNNFYHQYPIISRGEPREESLPAVDDGFLPPAAGTDGGRIWGFQIPEYM
jgi:hypothetical protein